MDTNLDSKKTTPWRPVHFFVFYELQYYTPQKKVEVVF